MKTYSSSVVTKEDLTASDELHSAELSRVDEKQDRQINQLRVALAISFVINLLATCGVYYVTRW